MQNTSQGKHVPSRWADCDDCPKRKRPRLWLESRALVAQVLPKKSKLCEGYFCRLSVKCKDRGIQRGINFENRGQVGKCQFPELKIDEKDLGA